MSDPTNPWITWDGSSWREYRSGDESHGSVLRAPFIRGTGALDPSIWVVTMHGSRKTVDEMHERYRAMRLPRSSGRHVHHFVNDVCECGERDA